MSNSDTPSTRSEHLSDDGSSLSDDDLLAILRKEEAAASNYQWSALSKTREDALAYYDREPYGDEQEGASQVVTSEFADVIESIMPGLMRVFTSTDDVAEFSPGAPGEERQATHSSSRPSAGRDRPDRGRSERPGRRAGDGAGTRRHRSSS